jgi:hypothetical protein
MRHLRWASHKGTLAPVDYRNMGPKNWAASTRACWNWCPTSTCRRAASALSASPREGSTAGNARKLSGSYYTPDSLVQELIKRARPGDRAAHAAAQPIPIEALLAIRVIDPACGSGHFLLAAARRLAEKLAQLRATDGANRTGLPPCPA